MRRITVVALMALALACMASPASAAYQVYTAGPLSTFSIDFFISNGGPGTIPRIEYDLTDTKSLAAGNPPLTIQSPIASQSGVTASPFYSNLAAPPDEYYGFGFDFTGFTSGNTFTFNWDPDIASDRGFGGIMGELSGSKVTLFTDGGTIAGVLLPDERQFRLEMQAVPVPGTLLLFGPGLAFLAALKRKFRG